MNQSQTSALMLTQSIVIPPATQQYDIKFADGNDAESKISALVQEVMTLNSNLAQQLAQKSGESNVNQLNDMLECISLMRIQFNHNKDQYNKMKNQVKQSKAAQTVYLEQLYEYKQRVKQLKIDYGTQTARL